MRDKRSTDEKHHLQRLQGAQHLVQVMKVRLSSTRTLKYCAVIEHASSAILRGKAQLGRHLAAAYSTRNSSKLGFIFTSRT